LFISLYFRILVKRNNHIKNIKMRQVKELQKSENITVRLTKSESELLQKEASDELLSISGLVRRKLFFNRFRTV
jgi:hypothetical protein